MEPTTSCNLDEIVSVVTHDDDDNGYDIYGCGMRTMGSGDLFGGLSLAANKFVYRSWASMFASFVGSNDLICAFIHL